MAKNILIAERVTETQLWDVSRVNGATTIWAARVRINVRTAGRAVTGVAVQTCAGHVTDDEATALGRWAAVTAGDRMEIEVPAES